MPVIDRSIDLLWVCHRNVLSIRVRAGIPLHNTPQCTQAPELSQPVKATSQCTQTKSWAKREKKRNLAGKRAGYLGYSLQLLLID